MNLQEVSKIEMRNRTIERSNKASKKWKSTNRKCVFPGCSCVAINSHTMSKEANLRCIAENGEVLNMKPLFKDGIRQLIPTPVGINEASTFRGFCKQHDEIFSKLDHGKIESKYDLILQCFRSVARWVALEENADIVFYELMKDLVDTRTGRDNCITEIAENRDMLNELKKTYNDLFVCIQQKAGNTEMIGDNTIFPINDDLSILYKHISYQIPIALCTKNPFQLCGKSGNKVFNIIWIVVPTDGATDIIVVLDTKNINRYLKGTTIEKYWNELIKNDCTVLEMIEAAMITNEEWYVKPSAYQKLSEVKKETIEFDIRYKCYGSYVWDCVDYTIFDDIWRKLLKNEKNEKVIRRYKSKLDFVPQLLSEEEKQSYEKEMCQKIVHLSFKSEEL